MATAHKRINNPSILGSVMKPNQAHMVKKVGAGVGAYFVGQLVGNFINRYLSNFYLDVLIPAGLSIAAFTVGRKYLNGYADAIALGAGVAAAKNVWGRFKAKGGLAGLGIFDAPARMGSRVHAEAGLSGHDLMSVENEENSDDLYEGVFAKARGEEY